MAIDIEKQKEKLDKDYKQIVEELKSIGIHNPQVKEDWIAIPAEKMDAEADPNEAADRVEDWDERRATMSVLETRYNNITNALKKIEEGTYGNCEVCGEAIEEERLEAYPEARTCLKHTEDLKE